MGYIRAEDVLPEEVIDLIWQYVDGELVYIPRKGQKRCWGSVTGTRDNLKLRNENIYTQYMKGISVQELAACYCLSEKSIQRIIREFKKSPPSESHILRALKGGK